MFLYVCIFTFICVYVCLSMCVCVASTKKRNYYIYERMWNSCSNIYLEIYVFLACFCCFVSLTLNYSSNNATTQNIKKSVREREKRRRKTLFELSTFLEITIRFLAFTACIQNLGFFFRFCFVYSSHHRRWTKGTEQEQDEAFLNIQPTTYIILFQSSTFDYINTYNAKQFSPYNIFAKYH